MSSTQEQEGGVPKVPLGQVTTSPAGGWRCNPDLDRDRCRRRRKVWTVRGRKKRRMFAAELAFPAVIVAF